MFLKVLFIAALLGFFAQDTFAKTYYLKSWDSKFLSDFIGWMREEKYRVTPFDFDNFLNVTTKEVHYENKGTFPSLEITSIRSLVFLHDYLTHTSIYLGNSSTVSSEEDVKRLTYDVLVLQEKSQYGKRLYIFRQSALKELLVEGQSIEKTAELYENQTVSEIMKSVGLDESTTQRLIKETIQKTNEAFKGNFSYLPVENYCKKFSELPFHEIYRLYFHLQENKDQIENETFKKLSKIFKLLILKKVSSYPIDPYGEDHHLSGKKLKLGKTTVYPSSHPRFLAEMRDKKEVTLLSLYPPRVTARIENNRIQELKIEEHRYYDSRKFIKGKILGDFSEAVPVNPDTKVTYLPNDGSESSLLTWKDCRISSFGTVRCFKKGEDHYGRVIQSNDVFLMKVKTDDGSQIFLMPKAYIQAVLVAESFDHSDSGNETLGQALESAGLMMSDEDKTRLAGTFNQKFNEVALETLYSLYRTFHYDWKEIEADVLKAVSTKLSQRILKMAPSVLIQNMPYSSYNPSKPKFEFLTFEGDRSSYREEFEKISEAIYLAYLRSGADLWTSDSRTQKFLILRDRFERTFLKISEALEKHSREDVRASESYRTALVEVMKSDLEGLIGTEMTKKKWLNAIGKTYKKIMQDSPFKEEEICERKYLLDASESAF